MCVSNEDEDFNDEDTDIDNLEEYDLDKEDWDNQALSEFWSKYKWRYVL